ncbi:MAG TPA: hypothetical protein VH877_16665 [Polyangia bacterium]|nr:hypothetical protein [Polyangia bacterium]
MRNVSRASIAVALVAVGLLASGRADAQPRRGRRYDHGGPPVVGAGEHCGGFIRNAPVCAEGLVCQLNISCPDCGGTCVPSTPDAGPPVVGLGEHCGGFILNAPVCQEPLVCQLNPTCPDCGGTCVAPECQADTDCTGILPQLCQVCADGSTQCAHFECINHKCETVVCPP